MNLNLGKLNLKKSLIDPSINGREFDLAIIGGGSGGIALGYEAQKLGLKPVLFDFVDPSTQGNVWGLGGTCVNVGCIPKKLFHNAALLKEQIELSEYYGYEIAHDQIKFDWEKLRNEVQLYIKSSNFGFKSELQTRDIPYVNAFASFKDKNTIVYSPIKEEIQKFLQNPDYKSENLGQISAKFGVIATGGRPTLLEDSQCLNLRKYSITSDDLFSLKKPPGKTLVVGGGYIALECAGFLNTLGFDTSIMTRSDYLRSMDRQSVQQLLDYLRDIEQLKIIPTSLPIEVQKTDKERLFVRWKNQKTQSISEDEFDTLMVAVGRSGNTKNMNLDRIGVKIRDENRKILGGNQGELELTSVDNIYAIGDVLEGVPELTPVAQKMASTVARKIASRMGLLKSSPKSRLRYDHSVPTVVFTPLEYGFIGLSEEQAVKKYGEQNLEIYLSQTTPLEENLNHRLNSENFNMTKNSFFKVICLKPQSDGGELKSTAEDSEREEKVIGLHYLGPHAGEVIQGYAVAFNMGMTKADLDATIGIHPTISEEFIQLKVTKSSGESFARTGC